MVPAQQAALQNKWLCSPTRSPTGRSSKQAPARLLPFTSSCYHIADKHHNLLFTVLQNGSPRWEYQWGWFRLILCPSCLQLLIILPRLLLVLWSSLYHKTQKGSKEPFQTLPAGSPKSSLKFLPSMIQLSSKSPPLRPTHWILDFNPTFGGELSSIYYWYLKGTKEIE